MKIKWGYTYSYIFLPYFMRRTMSTKVETNNTNTPTNCLLERQLSLLRLLLLIASFTNCNQWSALSVSEIPGITRKYHKRSDTSPPKLKTSDASLTMINSEKKVEVKSSKVILKICSFYRRTASQKTQTALVIDRVKDINIIFDKQLDLRKWTFRLIQLIERKINYSSQYISIKSR